VADRFVKPLSRDALAWAVARGLRFAIGTCVIALVLATTLGGAAAERLASAAYLAAIFAAIMLIAARFLPPPEERKGQSAAFPAFFSYSVSVALFLSVAAVLVSEPGAEAFAFVAALALVVIAVLARTGGLAAANAAIVQGGLLAAFRRYAVVVGTLALALVALLPADSTEGIAAFAYRITVFATLLLCGSLIAPTRLGRWVAASCMKLLQLVDQLARAFVFERAASYAAIVAVAVIVPASVLPQPFSEPFAVTAYAAALAAAVGVAMECRRLRS
jgi:hypothetical protein